VGHSAASEGFATVSQDLTLQFDSKRVTRFRPNLKVRWTAALPSRLASICWLDARTSAFHRRERRAAAAE